MRSVASGNFLRACVANLLFLVCSALPAQQTGDPVQVVNAWTRAMPPGVSTAAVYFSVTTKTDDELLRIVTPVAGDAQIHEVTQANGMMRMRPRSNVVLKAGIPMSFSPQSMHVMLMDVKEPLRAGTHVPMSLIFLHAGTVNIEVQVRTVDSRQ